MTDPVSTERLEEMLAGLEGVTPGPRHAYVSQEHVLVTDDAGNNIAYFLPMPENTSADFSNAASFCRLTPDTMRSILTELLASRQAPEGVRVRKLEWVNTDGQDEDGGYDVVGASADHPLAHYWITYADTRRDEIWLLMRDRGVIVGHYMTMVEAKAAAQADYDARILSAIEPVTQTVSEVPTYRHKKRGTEYVLIGIGKMQAEGWRDLRCGTESALRCVDMREVAIYRSATDPTEIWVRPREEFEDGRFEVLEAEEPR